MLHLDRQSAKHCAGIFTVDRGGDAPQQACRSGRTVFSISRRPCLSNGRADFPGHWTKSSSMCFYDKWQEVQIPLIALSLGILVLSLEIFVLRHTTVGS